jgi:glycosyltransferase involved in cell wall biosynthesis
MEKADIFVFPTLYPEGFPTVILEAAMQKCAIISTDRGGIKELITDNDIGVILKNDASDLTEKLENLLKDPEKIRKYGEKAFKKTNEKFTWDRTIKTIKEELRKYENN